MAAWWWPTPTIQRSCTSSSVIAPREAARELLRPLAADLALHPVTPRMNHYAYEAADAVLPATIEPQPGQLALPW